MSHFFDKTKLLIVNCLRKIIHRKPLLLAGLGKHPRVLHQDLLSEDPRKAGRDPVGSTVDANESAGLRDDPDDLPDAGNSTAINYLRVEVLLRAHLNDLVAAVC